MATCSPQTLISEGSCLLCLTKHELLVVIAQLLCEINEAGGLSLVQVYTGAFADPNGNVTPDDPTRAALFYPNGGGTQFQWDVVSQAWV